MKRILRLEVKTLAIIKYQWW